MSYTAVFWVFGRPETEEFETLDEAKEFLTEGEEYGRMSSVGIMDADNNPLCTGWPVFAESQDDNKNWGWRTGGGFDREMEKLQRSYDKAVD